MLTLPKVQPSQTNKTVKVNPSTTKQYPPGVYETAPFTGIVVVPSPQIDDKMMLAMKGASKGTLPSMPTVQPELRLIPRAPKK